MRTRAVRDGSGWVIDGTKNWTTNLGIAEFYTPGLADRPADL
jgi:alkylation response protein AidB-like acyl-CoA dehydrogenase